MNQNLKPTENQTESDGGESENYTRVETNEYGNTYYYNAKDQLHRIGGPANEKRDGTKHWYQNDKCHRLDGPASKWADGTKCWFVNGGLNRLDGPATEHPNGNVEYWIEGKKYTKEEFDVKVKELTKPLEIKMTAEVNAKVKDLTKD